MSNKDRENNELLQYGLVGALLLGAITFVSTFLGNNSSPAATAAAAGDVSAPAPSLPPPIKTGCGCGK